MSRRSSLASSPSIPRASLLWLLVGLGTALFLQWTQASAVGGWSGLLAVGEDATVRPLIEGDLPALVTVEGSGHDGQIGYAIALDLDGSEVGDLLVDAGYRYRRILLPVIASLGGALHGPALLAGFVLTTASGLGIASAALEGIRRRFGWSPWVHLAVLANPGLWMSVRLLTADVVGFGLATLAVAAYLDRRRRTTVLLLALAALAKDQYLLVALSLAGHQWFARRDRGAAATFGIPATSLLGWALWLQTRMDAGLSPRGNLTWPGAGIFASLGTWPTTSESDRLLVAVGIGMLVAGAVCAVRARSLLFRWLVAPWVLVALVSSDWVWTVGNNVVRVFAPLFALMTVAAVVSLRVSERPAEPLGVSTFGPTG